jgi:hypothetical protein
LARAMISAYEPFLGGFAGSTTDTVAGTAPLEGFGGLALPLVDAAALGLGFGTAGRGFAVFLICVLVVTELTRG